MPRQQFPDSPLTIREGSSPLSEPMDSIDAISREMKLMVKKIQDLRHIGIEDKGLPLPKICVVGDQSTGKSSLIEGMSEIQVPRSAGCCTRCPLEINLSESDSPDSAWSCRVLLMRKYIYNPLELRKASKSRSYLGPWTEQDPEEEVFMVLSDRSKLQEALKWAQIATLNPGRSYKDYIPGQNADMDEDLQVKFSPNVVRLDITAPSFPNLSFYDLPGVINVAEVEEEKYLVTLVENLVREYIKAKNCIVLLTVPMTDDATNSSAGRIIREVPGAIARTVGVLTKPDRVQFGEGYVQWARILQGDMFPVGHGYFVVKNNSNPLVEHYIAREEEEEFFAHGSWSDDLSRFNSRFGTRKLQIFLSQLLMKQIQDSVPGIRDQINIRYAKAELELSTLPDPPSANIPYLLCDKLNQYNNELQSNLGDGGSATERNFLKEWRKLAVDFQQSLIASRPTLRLAVQGEQFTVKRNLPTVPVRAPQAVHDEELELVSARPSPSPKRKVSPSNPDIDAEAKRFKKLASVPAFALTNDDSSATENFAKFRKPSKVFELKEIRDINSDTYISGLPGMANPLTVDILNRMSVQHWREPMEEFLKLSYQKMEAFLLEKVDEVFLPYRQTALYGELKAIIVDFLGTIRHQHYHLAYENYNVECQKPFTMAEDTYRRAQVEALNFFTRRRFESRAAALAAQVEKLAPENWGKRIDRSKITPEDVGEDEYAREISIMAASRAYYEIASSRFIDATCQSIYARLFLKCRDNLRSVIENKLGILEGNASERCMELMVEDPDRQMRRKVLRKELEKLNKAREWLRVDDGSEPMNMDMA